MRAATKPSPSAAGGAGSGSLPTTIVGQKAAASRSRRSSFESRWRVRIRAVRASSRARTGSQAASSAGFGTRTAVSSPRRSSSARCRAPRRRSFTPRIGDRAPSPTQQTPRICAIENPPTGTPPKAPRATGLASSCREVLMHLGDAVGQHVERLIVLLARQALDHDGIVELDLQVAQKAGQHIDRLAGPAV